MATRNPIRRSLPRRVFRLVLRCFALLCFSFVLACVGLAGYILLTYKTYADTLVPPTELLVNRPSSGAKILDRNGNVLYQYVDDVDGLRKPVKLSDVSPAFLAATIATEDANFFSNPGVNVKGLVRAGIENFNVHGDQGGYLKGTGGSSITQQLVKNLYVPRQERDKRSLSRKIQEVVYSIELSKRYDKAQILEWYVNQISYGGIYSGVEAASEGYFGKRASDLTVGEATLLAGIPQSPAAYDPVNHLDATLERRNEVLDLMVKRGQVQIGPDAFYAPTPAEVEEARSAPVRLQQPVFPIQAPHFVLTYVAPELEKLVGRDALLHDGLTITTTLDLDLQNKAQGILERYVAQYERVSNSHNGAVVILQPGTGQILTMVGSRDFFRDDVQGQVNNLLALNSPGSSFKPFVYLTSFLKLGWGPGAILQDSPVSFRESNGAVFQPQNPVKGSYAGAITVRNALGNSLNVPAFKTAVAVGVPDIVAMGKSVGLTRLDGTYGPSIAIGGVDVRPLDLAFAYTVLANGGVLSGQETIAPGKADERSIDPVSVLRITDGLGNVRFDAENVHADRRIVPAEYAYMITSILSDPGAECVTFGCGGLAIPGMQAAVKTGTSQPYDPSGPNGDKFGETWAFGYTPDLVVGVWNGNQNNAPVTNIFSTTISYPTMRDIMVAAHAGHPAPRFVQPPNVGVGRCSPKPAPVSLVTRSTSGFTQVTSCSNDLVARDGAGSVALPLPQQATSGLNGADTSPVVLQPDATATPAPPTTPTPPSSPTATVARATPNPTSPQPPAGAATGGGYAAITSPGSGSVGGVVSIQGRASSPAFQFYRLEIGLGASPSNWSALGQWASRVEGGLLGAWSTAGLSPGQYTIRLVVQDAAQGASVSSVTVSVGQ